MPTVEIYPTTGSDDGEVRSAQSTSYPPSSVGTVDTNADRIVLRRSRTSAGRYEGAVGLFRFDTSGIPSNATIQSASLRIRLVGRSVGNNLPLVVEWYAASNWPIDAGDYRSTAPTTNIAAQSDGSLTTGVHTLPLADAATRINRTGYTGLRLHVGNVTPTAQNTYSIASSEYATASDHPCLIVEYTLSDVDHITCTIAAYDDDINLVGEGETYPPPYDWRVFDDTTLYVVRQYWDDWYTTYQAVLRWDTSALAGKTVVAAELAIHLTNVIDIDGYSLRGEFITPSTWPASATDYRQVGGNDAIHGVPLTDVENGKVNVIPFDDVSGINTSGYTYLSLTLSNERVPTGVNQVRFASYEHATLPPPALIVYYAEGGQVYSLVLSTVSSSGSEMRRAVQVIRRTQTASQLRLSRHAGVVRRTRSVAPARVSRIVTVTRRVTTASQARGRRYVTVTRHAVTAAQAVVRRHASRYLAARSTTTGTVRRHVACTLCTVSRSTGSVTAILTPVLKLVLACTSRSRGQLSRHTAVVRRAISSGTGRLSRDLGLYRRAVTRHEARVVRQVRIWLRAVHASRLVWRFWTGAHYVLRLATVSQSTARRSVVVRIRRRGGTTSRGRLTRLLRVVWRGFGMHRAGLRTARHYHRVLAACSWSVTHLRRHVHIRRTARSGGRAVLRPALFRIRQRITGTMTAVRQITGRFRIRG